MGTQITSKLSIIIPRTTKMQLVTTEYIEALTKALGGCTRVEGNGIWYDKDGDEYIEPVAVYTWWYNPDRIVGFNYYDNYGYDHLYDGNSHGAVKILSSLIYECMFKEGEQAVMVEKTSAKHGTCAEMIYRNTSLN